MDNCFTGRCDRSRQTSEKDVLYILPAGPVTECAFARWHIVLHFLFTPCDVIASFVSSPNKTPSKMIVGADGWALPVHWILTYKNLIYLLNLQFYCVNTSYPMDNC